MQIKLWLIAVNYGRSEIVLNAIAAILQTLVVTTYSNSRFLAVVSKVPLLFGNILCKSKTLLHQRENPSVSAAVFETNNKRVTFKVTQTPFHLHSDALSSCHVIGWLYPPNLIEQAVSLFLSSRHESPSSCHNILIWFAQWGRFWSHYAQKMD